MVECCSQKEDLHDPFVAVPSSDIYPLPGLTEKSYFMYMNTRYTCGCFIQVNKWTNNASPAHRIFLCRVCSRELYQKPKTSFIT